MTKRFMAFLLALFILPLLPCAQAEVCNTCGGKGYVEMPLFGTGDLVHVNCPTCGGTLAATAAPVATPAPLQAVTSLTLPEPSDYANDDMPCIYAEKGFAVFQGNRQFDIDGYIAALALSGLEVVKEHEYYSGNIRYYQLNHPAFSTEQYQDTCHVAVYFDITGILTLAAAPEASIRFPACASITLPDPAPFANGEDRISSRYLNGVSFFCEEGYDIEGYINLLRNEYGFDVEGFDRYSDAGYQYGLNNVDIDTALFPIRSDTAITRATRQVEVTYTEARDHSKGKIGIFLPDVDGQVSSIIQLPVRDEGYYRSSVELTLPEPPSGGSCDIAPDDDRCSYTFAKPYDPLPYVVNLIEEGFTITGIEESGETTTYYLFKHGYHVKRIHHDTSHVRISYDSSDMKLTIRKAAFSLKLPVSGQPTEEPKYTPAPTSGSGGGGGGTVTHGPQKERCNQCNGGRRTCGSCFGNGYIDCGGCYDGCSQCGGDGRRNCPNSGCSGGTESCSFCGGDGWK